MTTLATCRTCRETKPIEDYYKHTRMANGRKSECKVCHIARTRARQRLTNPDRVAVCDRPATGTFCRGCKQPKTPDDFYRDKHKASGHAAHCKECHKAKGSPRRRARLFDVEFEKLDRRDVYERDGWICGLCCESVDPNEEWPSLLSASLDHVIPLSKGGPHVHSNVQLAHLGCNISKGNRQELAA